MNMAPFICRDILDIQDNNLNIKWNGEVPYMYKKTSEFMLIQELYMLVL